MRNKIVSLLIFAVAGIACILAILFVIGFDQDNVAKYNEIGLINEKNPTMLVDFQAATPETLSEFYTKYQAEAATLSADLKQQQLQKDITYTYLVQLKDLDENTFADYKNNFATNAASLFAKSDNADKYIKEFNQISDFKNLNAYIKKLTDEYTVIKNNFLNQKDYVKAYNSLLAQTDLISTYTQTKKATELANFQDSVKNYIREGKILNSALVVIYIIFFATIGLLLLFSLIALVKDFKNSYKILIVLAVFALIVFLGYLLASPELSPSAIKAQMTSSEVKWIEAGEITVYVFFFGAILAALSSIVVSAIKNRK